MNNPLIQDLARLASEGRNPDTLNIDTLSALDIVTLINRQDKGVPEAVARVLPAIAAAVDMIETALRAGGRLIYTGAGTSGRLGVLDASECPPTFSVPHGLVLGLIAGGEAAMFRAQEGAEDNERQGEQDLRDIQLTDKDVVVGIAASGRTPYVIGGLRYARRLGAGTAALACNAGSAIGREAAIAIEPEVGPEVITGSTRLKAGTAQKLVLNMLSTAAMIRLGKVYQNLMVDLHASNQKLEARAIRIVMQATGENENTAAEALAAADNEVKLAILMLLTGLGKTEAKERLTRGQGVLRRALAD
ncbi:MULTISPECIES: N-acetylmuramic acid 6-phosphate etherase [Oceanimonas]|uniref:N-acetylmuramic acid 6-phosphate etherase n=1 Tax=Oceanimonas doudoroffii TaxID=84158 RepID=A0A233RDT9_9GAMM|nr:MULTISPECIES: N-acetylmuramic acid 6-phosphate etherase [Oceanimonas]NHH99103.1 N-acetylmuramic acid 6-phosphate etherase [Oceanimonas sp. MB9]OXY81555.1 N-acetylmuramic acid 6-phosphate etherase [Oceanimonas doudoroffii]